MKISRVSGSSMFDGAAGKINVLWHSELFSVWLGQSLKTPQIQSRCCLNNEI